MSDEPTWDRRTFLTTASMALGAAGSGAVLWGCDKSKDRGDDRDDKTAGSGDSRDTGSAEEGGRQLEYDRLAAELEVVKNFNKINFDELDGDPFDKTLRAATRAPPVRVSWLVAPTGRALGVGAEGTGDDFASAVVDHVSHMLGKDAAAVVERLHGRAADATVSVETVLAEPSWFRAGVQIDAFGQLRGLLEGLRAPDDVLESMLRYQSVDGAQPVGLEMTKPSGTNKRLMATTRLPAGTEAEGIPDHVADKSVDVGVLADSERRWLRCPGLKDRELIKWQRGRGFRGGHDAAGRVGKIQSSLGTKGPDRMAWEQGKLEETLVYIYEAGADG